VCLVGFLFRENPEEAPCGAGGITDEANVSLPDWNGDGGIEIVDVVALLGWRWRHGPPHALGTDCVLLPGCPEVCSP
jgi:hypothetical protein